ncbi:DMT family transporter [Frankia sp. AgKG'84/4]|uniref:DMT family transporter n=1 Tax=Frankia sp. AgKG'84/4 TaxID=573490 RepID=UPI00200DECCE|nr:DMT family transporter [Frankia sp. AgKG'84/4]MCL9793816.1 DMT family transporter [Frankia sp. AgKG'84/4]
MASCEAQAGVGPGLRVRSGELSILLAAVAYGLSTTLSVAALHAVRPLDLLAVELAGAAAVLLGAALVTGRLRRRGAVRQMMLGALVPGLGYLLGDFGLDRTSASNGSLLLAAEPLLTVLLAVVALHERPERRAVVALAFGLAGGVLVALDPGSPGQPAGTTTGNLLVLAGVAVSAVFVVATRRYSDDDGDALNASAWQTAGGAVTATPFVAAAWASGDSQLTTADAAGWAACAGVLLCGAVAGIAFNRGIGRMPAARASQLLNLTPAIGTLSAVTLLGEHPTAPQLAGGVALFVGLTLLLRGAPDPAPRQPALDQAVDVPAAPAVPAASTTAATRASPV